jgi:Arc/MetJ family transcription regulator
LERGLGHANTFNKKNGKPLILTLLRTAHDVEEVGSREDGKKNSCRDSRPGCPGRAKLDSLPSPPPNCRLRYVIECTGGIRQISPDRPLDMYIHVIYFVYSRKEPTMAVTMTSIRLDTDLADEAVKILGAKSRTEAVHVALREIVALKRFKTLMKKNAGKLKFAGLDE